MQWSDEKKEKLAAGIQIFLITLAALWAVRDSVMSGNKKTRKMVKQSRKLAAKYEKNLRFQKFKLDKKLQEKKFERKIKELKSKGI